MIINQACLHMISAALEHPSLQIAVCFLSVLCTSFYPKKGARSSSSRRDAIEGSLNLRKSVYNSSSTALMMVLAKVGQMKIVQPPGGHKSRQKEFLKSFRGVL